MSIIKLTSGFSLIPEGTYVFRITNVEYDEKFGKLVIDLKTKDGLTYRDRYNLLKDNGQPNETALNIFSYFARAALNENDLNEIEPESLIGHFVEARVEHYAYESTKDGSTKTGVRLQDKKPSEGWEYTVPSPQKFDLKSFLNN